jgi:hypothetical protein
METADERKLLNAEVAKERQGSQRKTKIEPRTDTDETRKKEH